MTRQFTIQELIAIIQHAYQTMELPPNIMATTTDHWIGLSIDLARELKRQQELKANS